MHMIKTALPRWAASLAAAAVIVANRSKKEDKDYCDEDSSQRFGRALFIVAVIILLMPGDMKSQNLSIGPGNIAANHQDESFPMIVVDESKVITLSAGSYCANLFRYQALPTGTGDVTPVVLLATGNGSGWQPLAIGDAVTFTGGPAGFAGSPFGGTNCFTLSQTGTLYAGMYWYAISGLMPIGFRSVASGDSSFIRYSESGGGKGMGANPPLLGAPMSRGRIYGSETVRVFHRCRPGHSYGRRTLGSA